GMGAGENLASRFKPRTQGVWEMKIDPPITGMPGALLRAAVRDRQGNWSRIERSFSVGQGSADVSRLPRRVHVFEDYETEIEKRWWLRGSVDGKLVPSSLSASLPDRRACRAVETMDFDDLMGDASRGWKAVVFNPVPGPPMAAHTRLRFRYFLEGTDKLRVQI